MIQTWFKLDPRPLFSLVVRPEIKSTSDLKGKVFAVNAFGFSQAILTEAHLQHIGLKKGEYKLIAAGGTEGRLATMEMNLAHDPEKGTKGFGYSMKLLFLLDQNVAPSRSCR